MKKMFTFLALMALTVVTVAYAGNIHRDGDGVGLQVFAPQKTTSVTHTKADVRYTPSAGTKVVRIQPTAAVFAKLSSAQNHKDTVGYPLNANATTEHGIANRNGVGAVVDKIIFTGISSATKTIYIQEQ